MKHSVAIIGAGIGAEHLDGYLALPDRFSVDIICDLNTAKAEKLATKATNCRVMNDLELVLVEPEIDIIDICLPPYLHGTTVLKALAAGKHVVCEKPMAVSVEEADEMLLAMQKAGRILMPIFQYRYGHGLYQLARLVELDFCGKPLVATLETHWNRDANYYAMPWRGTWKGENGGAVLGHAIHIHDLITRFFGLACEVVAILDTRVNPIETEDCAAISMKTQSGGLVTSSVTLGAGEDSSRLRLVFAGLTAESGRDPYAPGRKGWTFTARDAKNNPALKQALAEIEAEALAMPQLFAGQFQALANHLDGEESDVVTAQDGIHSIELVAAIYHSARTAKIVRLPLERGTDICSNWIPENINKNDNFSQAGDTLGI